MNGNPIMLKGSNFKRGTGDEAGTTEGGKRVYYNGKSRPKAKPNATLNYPRPTYHKHLTPSDN